MPFTNVIQGPFDTELDETTELDDSSDELLSSELELTELEDSLEDEMLEDDTTELLEAGSGKPSQRTSSISKVPASPVWPVLWVASSQPFMTISWPVACGFSFGRLPSSSATTP